MTKSVDQFFVDGCGRCSLTGTPACKVHQWTAILQFLRTIMHDCGLSETAKWGVPVFTIDDKNVIIFIVLKDYCAIGFIKGALMTDEQQILVAQTDNVQSSRLVRFTKLEQAIDQVEIIKNYVLKAIEIEKSGQKVAYKSTDAYPVPDELTQAMEQNPEFKRAFEALTPGRQRGYLLHFAAPKQAKTRESRIEKAMSAIFQGKGIHD